MGIKQVKDGCWTFGDGDKVCYPYPVDSADVGASGVINIYCKNETERSASYVGVGYKDTTYTTSFSKEELYDIVFGGSKVIIHYLALDSYRVTYPISRLEFAPNDFIILSTVGMQLNDTTITVNICGNNSVILDLENQE